MTLRVWMAAGLSAAVAMSGEGAIRWPAHEVSVLTNVDVLVVGGASAGVAAAVEAVRQGATVLGDDICATLRLWLEPSPAVPPPLIEAMFAGPPDRPDGARLPLTSTADTPSDPRHCDTEPPRRLADNQLAAAGPRVGTTWPRVRTNSWELGPINWTPRVLGGVSEPPRVRPDALAAGPRRGHCRERRAA